MLERTLTSTSTKGKLAEDPRLQFQTRPTIRSNW